MDWLPRDTSNPFLVALKCRKLQVLMSQKNFILEHNSTSYRRVEETKEKEVKKRWNVVICSYIVNQ